MTSLTATMLRSPRFRSLRAGNSRWLAAVNDSLESRQSWTVAVSMVVLLQGLLIALHRPWLDEVQAVQLAVEAPDLATLLDWLRYEGHPPLYYLLLRALAHVMDPLATLPVFAALTAAVTHACILFGSSFTRAERLLISLSTFVLFDFSTLTRSMNLGVAAFVVAAALWRTRWSWLAIAILPMCDFLFGVLSGILVVLKLRDRDIYWPGVAGWFAMGLLAAYSIRPAEDVVPALQSTGVASEMLGYLERLGTLALPFQGGIMVRWDVPPVPIALIAWIPFVILCWTATARDPLHRLLLFGFILLTAIFSLTIYPLRIRHLMLIAILLVVLTWLRLPRSGPPGAGFRLWLTICALCGVATAALSIFLPFNTAPEVVRAIERKGLGDKHWMAWPDFRSPVVSALSGIDFEQTEKHCMVSGMKWNHRTALTTPGRLKRYLAAEVRRHGRFYLLSDRPLGVLGSKLVRSIGVVPAGYDGQAHYLYMVGPDAAERVVRLPPCMDNRRPFARLALHSS